jgi:hypothetical protein
MKHGGRPTTTAPRSSPLKAIVRGGWGVVFGLLSVLVFSVLVLKIGGISSAESTTRANQLLDEGRQTFRFDTATRRSGVERFTSTRRSRARSSAALAMVSARRRRSHWD